MASFFAQLWESVFSPGASPQLLVATHVSFVFLTLCLAWLIFLTRNVHFMVLLAISTALWITVTWFVAELRSAELKSNDELAAKPAAAAAADAEPAAAVAVTTARSTGASGASGAAATRSRKV
ncbi:LAFE_0C10330g1_1 [Lachancea fermentati]|uniref:LAFE_0C10330g1_1 n=1 Tax=Lachancea fermentati TaxID=4955 RepID=A0A1G4MAD6_LACFM|nr:LAFE_0C10330g1_1 [Lachancea fermentati]